MKYAADFRKIARDSLRNNWVFAIIAGLIVSIFGVDGNNTLDIQWNVDITNRSVDFSVAGQPIFSTNGGTSVFSDIWWTIGAVYIIWAALALAVIYIVVGGVLEVGYSKFNLGLVDRKPLPLNVLIQPFSIWTTAIVAKLLQTLFVFLWTLCFIIPGIIAQYSYAMTPYILAEHPQLSASEAIARSKAMMSGNRWRLFCLQFSFLGWAILAALTGGIGNLWLVPYMNTANAAFYREISGDFQEAYSTVEF